MIHPQFHPLDPEWIEFAGDPAPRMHRVRRDGTGMECLYEHGNDEFIVHETFLGATGDLVFTVSHTAVATVAAIERAGATPVLVDIEPDGFTMDPAALERALKAPPPGRPAANSRLS